MDEVEDTQEPAAAAAAAGGRPPYRNLKVWIHSFDLALDVFQITRHLEGAQGRTLTRRLIESSSRVPVAVARGQSSASATQFIKCLREGLVELSELETHLLMCAELGYLTGDQVRSLGVRVVEVRKLAAGLIRRLRAHAEGVPVEQPPGWSSSRGRGRTVPPAVRDKESGSALLVAMLVSAVLGVLGTVYLQLAHGETVISSRQRDRDQLLNVAETGARAVKRWFDQPVSGDPSDPAALRHGFLGRFDLRDPAWFVTVRRTIDDGDPSTLPVPADGTPGRERYRQGREVAAGYPHLDFFQKPYRGGTTLSFLGTEDGPDLVLEDQPGAVDLLDEMNAALFPRQEVTGRIERIEVYAPPWGPAGSVIDRLGVATVKVTAAKYPRLDRTGQVPTVPAGARAVGRSVVRMVLAEIPTNAPRGALDSCGEIQASGQMRARWGRVQAVGDITLPDTLDRLDTLVPSSFPYASFGRRITGTVSGGDLADWLGDSDDSIEDPWLKIVAGGDLIGWQSLPDQPFPYGQARPIDIDHSNLFQRAPGMTCPWFDYGLWKRIALAEMPSERDVHYFGFDAATGLFRERGAGPARSVRDWTHGRSGIFFFDTVDAALPGSGNLTPAVDITGGDWSTSGVIFLNAASFRASTVAGTPRVLLPPGEPFDDTDHDRLHDPGETFVNFRYATTIGAAAASDDMLEQPPAAQTGAAQSPDGETYARTTTLQRDAQGIPLLAPVNLFGVLYNSGDILMEGDSVTYGSLVAGRSMTQVAAGADTPWVYFDERLNSGEWPPPEIAMPRTFVLHWQTSRP